MTEQKAAKQPKVRSKKGHTNINQALFAFQSKNLKLERNGTSKSNGKEYKYVTLDDLINLVRPALMEEGMLFTQLIQTDTMETKLIHADSGSEIVSTINLGKPNNMQDYGARITYARRYALTAILGLNAEEDTDAALPTQNDPMQVNPAIGVILTPQNTKKEDKSIIVTPSNIKNVIGGIQHEISNSVPKVPEALKSESYRKAKNAIDTAYSTEALDLITEKIKVSTKLTDIEKGVLAEDWAVREKKLGEVVRN